MIYFFVYTPAGRYTKKELIIREYETFSVK